jgi:uncharacterized membrane protein YfhO
VVVAESWDEGWRGSIDDQRSVPLERSDGVLIASGVEPGTHTLRLRYLPRGLWAGLAASVIGAGLLALAAARDAAAGRAARGVAPAATGAGTREEAKA